MSGFKEGAASSGLGDDDDDEPEDQLDSEEKSLEENGERPSTVAETSTDDSQTALPWIYERSGIADGRPNTVQLHLQESTVNEEYESKSEIEDLLGESVKKADLREAAYLVGLSQTDEVADKLREWGYDLS
jgi:hypothetical protein